MLQVSDASGQQCVFCAQSAQKFAYFPLFNTPKTRRGLVRDSSYDIKVKHLG